MYSNFLIERFVFGNHRGHKMRDFFVIESIMQNALNIHMANSKTRIVVINISSHKSNDFN